jgi:hypothetical protein
MANRWPPTSSGTLSVGTCNRAVLLVGTTTSGTNTKKRGRPNVQVRTLNTKSADALVGKMENASKSGTTSNREYRAKERPTV